MLSSRHLLLWWQISQRLLHNSGLVAIFLQTLPKRDLLEEQMVIMGPRWAGTGLIMQHQQPKYWIYKIISAKLHQRRLIKEQVYQTNRHKYHETKQNSMIISNYTLKSSHYGNVIMGAMASQITSVSIVCWTICSGPDERKHQSSASLTFVRGIHRWPVNFPHRGSVMWKMFPFDDIIMADDKYVASFITDMWHMAGSNTTRDVLLRVGGQIVIHRDTKVY